MIMSEFKGLRGEKIKWIARFKDDALERPVRTEDGGKPASWIHSWYNREEYFHVRLKGYIKNYRNMVEVKTVQTVLQSFTP